MPTEPMLAPINVRFPRELSARIAVLCRKFGVSKSDIIRQALASKVPEWEQRGIRLVDLR